MCKIGWALITLCVVAGYLSWTEIPAASVPWPEIHTDKTHRLSR